MLYLNTQLNKNSHTIKYIEIPQTQKSKYNETNNIKTAKVKNRGGFIQNTIERTY